MRAAESLDAAHTTDAAGQETWRLSREISETRGDLDRYIGELGRRRREMTDVRLQVRRHPGIVVALGVVVAAAVGGAVWKAHRARKRRAVSGIRRALSSLGNWRNVAPPPRERTGGGFLGVLAKAGVPLGIVLVKGLLRLAGDAGSRTRGR